MITIAAPGGPGNERADSPAHKTACPARESRLPGTESRLPGCRCEHPASGCWEGSQSAGPAVRVTVAVCDWPDWSVQPMLILSPGWYFASTDPMPEEDVTV